MVLSSFPLKIHSFHNEEQEYYLELEVVSTLVIISVTEIGINCIALIHLYKERNTESCSTL